MIAKCAGLATHTKLPRLKGENNIILPIINNILNKRKEYAYLAILMLPCNKLHLNRMTKAKASVPSNIKPIGKFKNEQLAMFLKRSSNFIQEIEYRKHLSI